MDDKEVDITSTEKQISNKSEINIWIWTFFALWVVYAFASFLALFFTSGGWTSLFVGFAGLVFYGLLSLIILVETIIKTVRGETVVNFNPRIILFVIILQALFLVGNFGDCGDSECSSKMILYELGGSGMYASGYNFAQIVSHYLNFDQTFIGVLFAYIGVSFFRVAALGYVLALVALLNEALFGKGSYVFVKYVFVAVLLIGTFLLLSKYSTIYNRYQLVEGMANSDSSRCNLITSNSDKITCYRKIAKETRDSNVCDSIIGTDQYSSTLRDVCYVATYQYQNRPTYDLCLKISNDVERNDCLSIVGEARACEGIVDGTGFNHTRNGCYFQLVTNIETGIWDSKFCEEIRGDDSLKETCYQRVESFKGN